MPIDYQIPMSVRAPNLGDLLPAYMQGANFRRQGQAQDQQMEINRYKFEQSKLPPAAKPLNELQMQELATKKQDYNTKRLGLLGDVMSGLPAEVRQEVLDEHTDLLEYFGFDAKDQPGIEETFKKMSTPAATRATISSRETMQGITNERSNADKAAKEAAERTRNETVGSLLGEYQGMITNINPNSQDAAARYASAKSTLASKSPEYREDIYKFPDDPGKFINPSQAKSGIGGALERRQIRSAGANINKDIRMVTGAWQRVNASTKSTAWGTSVGDVDLMDAVAIVNTGRVPTEAQYDENKTSMGLADIPFKTWANVKRGGAKLDAGTRERMLDQLNEATKAKLEAHVIDMQEQSDLARLNGLDPKSMFVIPGAFQQADAKLLGGQLTKEIREFMGSVPTERKVELGDFKFEEVGKPTAPKETKTRSGKIIRVKE